MAWFVNTCLYSATGSYLEQKISGNKVSVKKAVTSGITNAVSGGAYGKVQ